MKTVINLLIILSIVASFGYLNSCKDPIEPVANVEINFLHKLDGKDISFDTMKYTNAAGNTYEVSEVKWFVSDIIFKRDDGMETLIGEKTDETILDDLHYIDTDVPSTHKLTMNYLPAGKYESITLTFGISESKNISYMFLNPPEANMLWPDFLGGGYHYMMLNGFYMDTKENKRKAFNYHLGIGQIRDATGKVERFVQNYVTITIKNSSFEVMEDGTISMNIVMNLENWFQNPHNYDIEAIGGSIMENQDAQILGKENALDVFTISFN